MPRARRKTATDILMNQGVRWGAFFSCHAAAVHASHTPNDGGKGAERCLTKTQPGTPARQTPLRTTVELSAHRWLILRIVECD